MLKIRQDMGRFEHLAQTALNTKLAKLAQDRDTMLMTILGGGLFALICMVAALHLIAHSITTPLERLATAVDGGRYASDPARPGDDTNG
jgi:hypothetical protein